MSRGKKKEKEKRRNACQPCAGAHGLPFARRTSMPLILRSYFPWSEPIKDFQPLWREQFQITLDSLVNFFFFAYQALAAFSTWHSDLDARGLEACVRWVCVECVLCVHFWSSFPLFLSTADAFRLQRGREKPTNIWHLHAPYSSVIPVASCPSCNYSN